MYIIEMFPENYLLFLQIIIVMFVTPGGPRVLIMSQSINYGLKKVYGQLLVM